MSISEDILGLSIVAWGNSLVDLVVNVIVTSKGFPAMAFSACFAAPVFSNDFYYFINIILLICRDPGFGKFLGAPPA